MADVINSNGSDNPVSAVYDKIAASINFQPVTEQGSLTIDHWHGNAVIRRYRIAEDGTCELSPIPDVAVINSNDFTATGAEDPAFAAFYQGVLSLIQRYVNAKGY
jgi:hypothetical protein